MRSVGMAAGTALGATAGVLLVLALREPHPARSAVLAAVGSAALALSGLALGAAALDWLGRIPLLRASAVDQRMPPLAAPVTPGTPAIDPGRANPKLLDTNVIQTTAGRMIFAQHLPGDAAAGVIEATP